MTTQLVLLGTGTPNCEVGRVQQGAAVITEGQPYLIDCGGGIMQRIAEARAGGMAAFDMARLTRLFLTHLHPDHTAGLADLILAPWVLGRAAPLRIFGPIGTQALVDNLLQGYAIGIGEHRDGLAPIDNPLAVVVTEIEAGEVYADAAVRVEAFRVSHGGLDAFGYRFTTADRIIVHSGDTCPVPVMVEMAAGCDILVHEVYCAASLSWHSERWQRYHRSVHTSGVELAALAAEAQPKLLVLNHQLIWGDWTEVDLMAEIAAGYDGRVVYGRDLDLF